MNNLNALNEEDKKIIQDFNRNVAWLKAQTLKLSKPCWVKSDDIKELTGWDTNKMRRARTNEVIVFKVINGERMYDLNSLPTQFIRQKTNIENLLDIPVNLEIRREAIQTGIAKLFPSRNPK